MSKVFIYVNFITNYRMKGTNYFLFLSRPRPKSRKARHRRTKYDGDGGGIKSGHFDYNSI